MKQGSGGSETKEVVGSVLKLNDKKKLFNSIWRGYIPYGKILHTHRVILHIVSSSKLEVSSIPTQKIKHFSILTSNFLDNLKPPNNDMCKLIWEIVTDLLTDISGGVELCRQE